MKKFYLPCIIFSVLLLTACSKDFLKPYEDRIIGTWRIADVKKFGLGGNSDNLPFRQGYFTFNRDGTMAYTNDAGDVYQGSWDIRKKHINEETYQSLQVTTVNFTTQQVLTEYYDDLQFSGTDHFKGSITSNFHTYITHFRR